MDIATSSRLALPARSPMPLMVHSTCLAPLATPARELAVDKPRSFWQCVEMTYWPGTFALMPAMSWPNSSGRQMPTVSGMFSVVAPEADTFEWKLKGVPAADGPGVSGSATDTLTLNASLANEGRVEVTVSSPFGSTDSAPAFLVITPDPSQFPEDLDDSGTVDLPDLLQLLARFGQSEP